MKAGSNMFCFMQFARLLLFRVKNWDFYECTPERHRMKQAWLTAITPGSFASPGGK